jgi:N utilization substance protein B
MGARRLGRELALQALYQLEMTSASPGEALKAALSAQEGEVPPAPDALRFAEELLEGVAADLADIDKLITEHSHNWRIDRMGRIDRNVLRLCIHELMRRPDIPKKVSINEGIELGKKFGTKDSPSFINGLLDRIALALGKE